MRKVLIIGAGLIGNKRAKFLPKNLELFGVFDLDFKKSMDFAEEYNCVNFQTLDEAFLLLPSNSLVVIAVRHANLAELARKSIEMKSHVLIEKPGAINAEKMKELIMLADNIGVTISVGYNHRFHGAAIELKKILNSQEYGEIQLIRARYGHGGRLGYEKEWRTDYKHSGGGELLDQGSHLLDLLNFFGTEPVLEFSLLPTLYWKIDVEDNAFLAGRLTNSGVFWIHASWTEWKNLFSFEVFLKTAKIEWSGLHGSYGAERLVIHHMEDGLGIPTEKIMEFPEIDESWLLEMIEVEKRIRNNISESASGECARKVLEIIDMAYQK